MEELNEETRKRRETEVIQQCGGILPYYEAFYIESILYAAGRCEEAFRRFDAAVAKGESNAIIFATMQEGLTHAAALSRFFGQRRLARFSKQEATACVKRSNLKIRRP